MLPDLPGYMFEPNLRGLVSLLLTVLLPILIGLLTKPSTQPAIKALGLLALAAVKTVAESYLVTGGANLTLVIYGVVINFIIAVTIHYGLFRPTGASAAAQRTLIK